MNRKRYTLAELNRSPLDQITRSTPFDVLEHLEARLETALRDQPLGDPVLDQIADLFADAATELDRIDQENA